MTMQGDVGRDIEISALHKDHTVTLKFMWTIENLFSEIKKGCKSPRIKLPDGTLQFFLTKYVNLVTYTVTNFVQLSVDSSSSMHISGYININGVLFSLSRSLSSGLKSSVWKSENISNCKFEFVFDLKVYAFNEKNVIVTESDRRGTKTEIDPYRLHLQKNIQNLWQNHPSSDIRIQVANETIPAHKIILSASSPVFARMFQNPTTIEVADNVVSITDASLATMKLLIGFMYGHFPNLSAIEDLSELYELYYASDKYEVLYLRNVCGRALVSRMTVENVHQLIEVFDKHSDSELEMQVVNFCCLHYKDVVQRDEWKNVMNSKIFVLIVEKIAKFLK